MYSARISRHRPAAFIIMIDQSGSMAEPTVFNEERVSKAEAVAMIVNMLISELLRRSRCEGSYRDYFDVAVQGYHGEEVHSLWRDPTQVFMRTGDLVGNWIRQVDLQRTRRLPDGHYVVSSVRQRIWVEPFCEGKTPMYQALSRCYQICSAWCSMKSHRRSYPPTIFNITDGESSGGSDLQLVEMSERIRRLSTEDGHALLINIHISSNATSTPVIFPESEGELPERRYARLLYRMSSEMPENYNKHIMQLRSSSGDHFRGVSYNAAMTDLINMMNIGSVSENLVF